MPPQLGYPTRAPGLFNITLELDPIWERMAQEFANVSTSILEEEILEMARAVATELIERQIPAQTQSFAYTGRLGEKSTWRSWILPPRRRGDAILRTVTIGLRASPRAVPESIGKNVRSYARLLEEGGARPFRYWSKMGRLRLEAWAQAKGKTRVEGRQIMAAIAKRGHKTLPHPYLLPAARATESEAMRWLEEGGKKWRDRVESHFVT